MSTTKAPHVPVRPAWLAMHVEDAIDPARPIIDAHHHLWDFEGRRYLKDDFLADLQSGHDVRASVFIECGMRYDASRPEGFATVSEVEFVIDETRNAPEGMAAAIVANADLRLGERVAPVLEAMIEAGQGRVKGVRNIGVWHADPSVKASAATPPPHLLLDAGFRAGLAQLAPLGLSFDAWVVHTQLDELCDLAGAFDDTRIVLNHVGGPLALGPYRGHRDEVLNAWRESVRVLSRYPNVSIKLGGFGMALFGLDFHEAPHPPDSHRFAAAIAPYVETCVEAFGASRCMFESNFPVDKGNVSYGVLWNAYKRVTAACSEDEKTALFAGSAASFYGLNAHTV